MKGCVGVGDEVDGKGREKVQGGPSLNERSRRRYGGCCPVFTFSKVRD
jgi:hypothetical protein